MQNKFRLFYLFPSVTLYRTLWIFSHLRLGGSRVVLYSRFKKMEVHDALNEALRWIL